MQATARGWRGDLANHGRVSALKAGPMLSEAMSGQEICRLVNTAMSADVRSIKAISVEPENWTVQSS